MAWAGQPGGAEDVNRRALNRLGTLCGLVGVAGNVAGVLLPSDVPSAYRPEAVGAWCEQVIAAPVAASWSAAAFTLGLVALVGWALALGRALGSHRLCSPRRPLPRARS
jgi:hypothetical protein